MTCIWIQTVLWDGCGLALGHNILRPFPHLVFIGAGWLGLGELVSDCPVPRLLHQQTVIIPAVIILAVIILAVIILAVIIPAVIIPAVITTVTTMQQWSESGKCADRRLMELCPRPHAALPPPNI